MLGIETQGGKSGGQKAGLLLNITEGVEGEGARQETGGTRGTMTNVSEPQSHVVFLLLVFFFEKKFIPSYNKSTKVLLEGLGRCVFRESETTAQVRFQVQTPTTAVSCNSQL